MRVYVTFLVLDSVGKKGFVEFDFPVVVSGVGGDDDTMCIWLMSHIVRCIYLLSSHLSRLYILTVTHSHATRHTRTSVHPHVICDRSSVIHIATKDK